MNDWCTTHDEWSLFCPCRDTFDQDHQALDSISLCSLPTLETPNFSPEQTPNHSSVDQGSMAKAYELYAPDTYQSSSPSTKTFLDRLGFKPKSNKAAADARHQFEKDFRAYVCAPIWQYLRKEDNPPAFNALIIGFLEKHGAEYWGDRNRSHLAEPDPSKGFLCPRDYRRPDSHFLEMVEKFFHYRAMAHIYQDRHKAKQGRKSVLATLDFSSLTPEDVEALNDPDMKSAVVPDKSRRRRSDSEESESEPDFENDYSLSQPRSKRRKTPHWKVKEASLHRRKNDARCQTQRENSAEEMIAGSAVYRKSPEGNTRPFGRTPKTTIKKSAISVLRKRPDTQTRHRGHRDATEDDSSSISTFDRSLADYSTPRTTDSATRKRARPPEIYEDRTRLPVPVRLYKQQIKDDSRTAEIKVSEDIIKRYKLQENLASSLILEDPNKPRRYGLFVKKTSSRSAPKTCNDATTAILVEDSDDNVVYDLPGEARKPQAAQIHPLFQTTVPNSPQEFGKIKSEHLPYNITSKFTMLVSATNQQDMAPVTVNLSTYQADQNFFDFLAEECELGSKSKEVTAISATYLWDNKRHRFRRHKMEPDWEAFCAKLRETLPKQTDLAEKGYEIEMLLHVGS